MGVGKHERQMEGRRRHILTAIENMEKGISEKINIYHANRKKQVDKWFLDTKAKIDQQKDEQNRLAEEVINDRSDLLAQIARLEEAHKKFVRQVELAVGVFGFALMVITLVLGLI